MSCQGSTKCKFGPNDRRNQTEEVKLTKIILNYSDWRASMTFFAFQITIFSSKLSIISLIFKTFWPKITHFRDFEVWNLWKIPNLYHYDGFKYTNHVTGRRRDDQRDELFDFFRSAVCLIIIKCYHRFSKWKFRRPIGPKIRKFESFAIGFNFILFSSQVIQNSSRSF